MAPPGEPRTENQESQPAPARADLQAPRRGTLYGRRGAVAAGQPLASLVGLDVLRAGGNAIDATIAVSAVMVVVQPYSSHLGGDGFALIRTAAGETAALNAGGRAPVAATPDAYAGGIPQRGCAAVAVPGLVDAWFAIHSRFATKPMAELLAPAIAFARDGFPLSRGVSLVIAGGQRWLAEDPGLAEVFLRDGPPAAGATLRQPDLARTLEAIAQGGRDAFYGGEPGRRIVEHVQESGGRLATEDLAENQAVWGEPLRIQYHDWTVYEQPLPSQGFMTLEALNIVEGFGLGEHPLASAEAVHPAVEAIRLAFSDRDAFIGDPDAVAVPIERLLSKEYAAEQRGRIGPRAGETVAASYGDTTSFAAADEYGNLVSFIQSIFDPWGSGVLVPGTGVILNNRMSGFSLDPQSPNVLRPGKRTVHTLNTWLLEREGTVYAGGTPGADTQIQVNLQAITAIADWGLGAQSAIDSPKWAITSHAGRRLTTVLPGDGLVLESRFPAETAADLERRGHRVVRASAWEAALSRMQIVVRQPDGALAAASDLRAEGAALTW